MDVVRERIAADEQGLEAEHLPKPLVLDVLRDETVHRAPALERAMAGSTRSIVDARSNG